MTKNVFLPVCLLLCFGCSHPEGRVEKVVLISANVEWKVVKDVFPYQAIRRSPWGEYFIKDIGVGNKKEPVLFFHGGWGKVAAAGSTQYCIDHWNPKYIINIGTCGGFEGEIKKLEIVLVDKTIIYDIEEAMGDSQEAISDYSTVLDLSWLGDRFPKEVTKTLLVSADRDIVPAEIPKLITQYHAVAGDWETGAIAYTCMKNKQRVLILRGVSDLVSPQRGGEAYQNDSIFILGTDNVMKKLLEDLPFWPEKCR
jgi:adenosylhomocysteine nucleosidase